MKYLNTPAFHVFVTVIVLAITCSCYALSTSDMLYLRGKDFVSNYFGANIIRSGNISKLYDFQTQKNYRIATLGLTPRTAPKFLLPYMNQPALGLVYLPFTFLPLDKAYLLFVIILNLCLVPICYYISKTYKINYFLLFALTLLNPVVAIGLFQGQPSVIFLAAVCGALLLVKKGKYFFAGLLLSLLLLKFQLFLISLIFAALIKKKQMFYGLALGSFIIALVNLGMYGLKLVPDYINLLTVTESPAYGNRLYSSHTLKNLLDVLNIAEKNPWNVALIVNVVLIAVLFILLIFYRNKLNGSIEAKLCFAVFSGLLLGAHIGSYDLIFLFFPLVFYAKTKLNGQVAPILIFTLMGLIPLVEYVHIYLNIFSTLTMLGFAVYYGKETLTQ